MNPLKKKLYKTALLSSPFLALYGLTPVYLFNTGTISFNALVAAFFILLLNILLFWAINIYVLNYDKISSPTLKYAISYLVTNIIQFLLAAVINPPHFPYLNRFILFYPLLFILAVNTIIIIICNSVMMAEKKKAAERLVEELKFSNLEAQKKVLMQQLQPHFLFNTLSVLKSLIKENADDAEAYAIKLSEFLRYTIQAHSNALVTLEDELEFTKGYLELQKVRFGNSLICSIDIPAGMLDWKLPAFSLQTLVENAIKHNAFTERKPLHIKISYLDQSIIVWNNKLPFKVEDSIGTGLKNLGDRYKLISGKEIEVKDGGSESSVTVKLLMPDHHYADSNY